MEISDEEIIALFDGRCARCIVNWSSAIHHIVPKSAGGPDTPENKIPLCTECHEFITETGHRRYIKELQRMRIERLEYFDKLISS